MASRATADLLLVGSLPAESTDATFPEWPMYEARDLGVLVRMANFAVEHSGRTVDWLHLAGPRYLRSEDERFFAPLRDLRPRDARVFLGIIIPLDGVSGLRRRHATASKFLHRDDARAPARGALNP